MAIHETQKRPDRAGCDTATVATILEPAMRDRIDAAAEGHFSTLHAESLSDAMRALQDRPVHAVLVSPRAIGRDELPAVGALVTRFPGVPMVAVVSQHDPVSSERLLELGARGVRRIVDLTARDGWSKLRGLVVELGGRTAALILGSVMPALGDSTDETRCFFEHLVRVAPRVSTAKALARGFPVEPTTLMSRFLRANLPSPKRYLAATRLLYAAAFLGMPGLSVTDVTYRLGYSSPQSFGRHVRSEMGLTAAEFRRRYSFSVALDEYTARLVFPFRATFRAFHPLQFS